MQKTDPIVFGRLMTELHEWIIKRDIPRPLLIFILTETMIQVFGPNEDLGKLKEFIVMILDERIKYGEEP